MNDEFLDNLKQELLYLNDMLGIRKKSDCKKAAAKKIVEKNDFKVKHLLTDYKNEIEKHNAIERCSASNDRRSHGERD